MPSLRDFGKPVSIHDQGFRSLCSLHPWLSSAAALRLMNADQILHLILFRGRKIIGNHESMPNSVLAGDGLQEFARMLTHGGSQIQ
jgi:hypothetical protein